MRIGAVEAENKGPSIARKAELLEARTRIIIFDQRFFRVTPSIDRGMSKPESEMRSGFRLPLLRKGAAEQQRIAIGRNAADEGPALRKKRRRNALDRQPIPVRILRGVPDI